MKKAMEKNGWAQKRYLIDGFPRGQENLDNWQKIFGDSVDVPFVVFFEANEETMIETFKEMICKIKAEIDSERADREECEETLLRLLDETCSKL